MWATNFTFDELAAISKRHLDSLELWLRSTIHIVLHKKFGQNYYQAIKQDGNPVFGPSIEKDISDRFNRQPHDYARWIDAAYLTQLVKMVTGDLYESDFKAPAFVGVLHQQTDTLVRKSSLRCYSINTYVP